MKKVYPLNEPISSNTVKKYNEITPFKNKDKENQKMKSPFPLKKERKSVEKLQNNRKNREFRKTPAKTKERVSINKFLENNNECNKTNNNSTIINPNDKQLFLVACLLANNKNNNSNNKIINDQSNNKANNILLSMKKNKECKKYVNKIKSTLVYGKNHNQKNNERRKDSKINIDNSKRNIGEKTDINMKVENITKNNFTSFNSNNNFKDKINNYIEKKDQIEQNKKILK